MTRLRSETHMRWAALTSALSLCVLVGALLGATLHDTEHAFGDGDSPCGVCLHAERVDGAATTAPSVLGTRPPDATVDVCQTVGMVPFRVAKEHRPRAPPSCG